VFAHRGDEVSDTYPIARYAENPVEDGVRGIELFIKSLKGISVGSAKAV